MLETSLMKTALSFGDDTNMSNESKVQHFGHEISSYYNQAFDKSEVGVAATVGNTGLKKIKEIDEDVTATIFPNSEERKGTSVIEKQIDSIYPPKLSS